MTDIELPNGDEVSAGDVILFEGYPYRVEHDGEIVLSPVFWGDSALDLTFETDAELAAAWGDESAGLMSESEWETWLADARLDDRFTDDELDAIRDAVLQSPGIIDRLRRWLGFD